MKLITGLPCLLLLISLSCQTRQTEQRASEPETPGLLRLKPETFSYREGRCDSVENQGVAVRASYVLLDDDSEAARRINDTLRAYLIRAVTDNLDRAALTEHPEARTDLNAAARLFARGYRQLREEYQEMPLGGCWEIEAKSDTLFSSERFVSVRLETYANTGGAHPNTATTLFTFDRQAGRTLHLADLVADTLAAQTLVEAAFRKKQGLKPDQGLETEGYFLRDGEFFLPQNVAVGRNGLIFYYNPYEIAAYALGPIELVIPYDKLPLLP